MNLQDFHSDKLVSEQLETEMSNVLTILGENVRRPGLQMFVDIIIISIPKDTRKTRRQYCGLRFLKRIITRWL